MEVSLTYVDKNQFTNVYLNGAVIGYILSSDGKWFYSPKGKLRCGRKMDSRRAVKEELGEKLRGLMQLRGFGPDTVRNDLNELITE